MTVEFVMPTLGADMSAGTLVRWRKEPGDPVGRGDIIADVETDKATIEVEVWTAGVVEKLLVDEGVKVPVGTPLALISENGAAEAPQASPAAVAEEPPEPQPDHSPAPVEPASRPLLEEEHRLLVSPAAKHLADELGVDLASVVGTGPGGRIQRRDIEQLAAAAAPKKEPEPEVASAPAAREPSPAEADGREAAMRRAISASMARSKREIPHFYLWSTIDMTEAVRWLQDENQHRSVTDRLLPGVLTLKATALALRQVSDLNQLWDGDSAVPSERVHVGVAISLRGGGLVAPAIHDTDQLSLDELMGTFRDLVARARAGRLRSSEYSDPTITVTSLGERGVEGVLPVIFPPQVAIVGFGTMVDRPLVHDGQLLVCPSLTATLAADHRVTDGHRAAHFLNVLDDLLQKPEEL
jgi:pyruvate dehydrogenase E2 component (dihydrolipoamide acetyltransferase)